MHQSNVFSRFILILTVITFASAAPALVQLQEKRQAPDDVSSVLGKRILEEDFNVLWDGWWHHLNVLGEPPPRPQLLRTSPVQVPVPEVHVPPQSTAGLNHEPTNLGADATPLRAPQSNPGWDSSDSDSSWSTAISNSPSDPKDPLLSERPLPRAADYDLKGNARVNRRISGSTSGVGQGERGSDGVTGVAECH